MEGIFMKVPVFMTVLVLVSLFTVSFVLAADKAPCQGIVFPSNTADLLVNLDSYTSVLAECPVEIPGGFILGDVDIRLAILMGDDSEQIVTMTLKDGGVIAVSSLESEASYFVEISECELDTILGAPSRRGAVADLYLDELFDIKAKGFFSKAKWMVAKPVLKIALKKMRVETELLC